MMAYAVRMVCHVAILKPIYVNAILSGAKTIESRLMKVAMAPYGQVAVGDRLFIKDSGGPFRATAVVDDVDEYNNLQPDEVMRLHEAYVDRVGGEYAYWWGKRMSRYAVFMHLTEVEPIDVGPRYQKSGYRAWFVLDERLSPLREVVLTAGAIRNRYVRPSKAAGWSPRRMKLILPDGEEVDTMLAERGLIQWRGWARYFDEYAMAAGDRVRFVLQGTDVLPDGERVNRYRVSFHKARFVRHSDVNASVVAS